MISDKKKREIEAFADRILRSYFCEGDVEFLISTFTPDIVWMAPVKSRLQRGVRRSRSFSVQAKMQRSHVIQRILSL
ncbi:hypothetical protein [Clostridium sp. AM58-1XD]|uniref:hypothetical protein n=1 Tax=Clostridium sp. AM58-1XD TaxID=2292307 RepID=UPI0026B15C4A